MLLRRRRTLYQPPGKRCGAVLVRGSRSVRALAARLRACQERLTQRVVVSVARCLHRWPGGGARRMTVKLQKARPYRRTVTVKRVAFGHRSRRAASFRGGISVHRPRPPDARPTDAYQSAKLARLARSVNGFWRDGYLQRCSRHRGTSAVTIGEQGLSPRPALFPAQEDGPVNIP
jgi:hypothetical protein